MPGVRSIAMKSIRTTIQLYSLRKEIGAGLPVCKIFLIHPWNFFLNQNGVEFYLSIGRALVFFLFF